MDSVTLETFAAVARQRSFSKAALILNRSQPTISRRIAQLEHELGGPLFERLPGPVLLTDLGRAFLPHAEAALAASAAGLQAIRDLRSDGSGSLSLSVVGVLLEQRLAAKLRRVCDEASPDALQIMTATSETVSQHVRSGVASIGVRYFDDRSPDIVCQPLGQEHMVTVAAPGFAPQAPSRRWLASTRWISFTSTSANRDGFGRLLVSRLARLSAEQADIMVVDALSAQKRLVEQGFGLGFLPRSSIAAELEKGDLVILEEDEISTTIPICLIQRRNGYQSPIAMRFIQEATEAALWA